MVRNYKSAIFELLDDPIIDTPRVISQFLSSLGSTTLRRPPSSPSLDITPILTQIIEWGPLAELPLPRLTAKLCWLLAICGFLRPSDLERTDADTTRWSPDSLELFILAPKDKRNGQRYCRHVTIQPFEQALLCPVLTFSCYMSRFPYPSDMTKHPVLRDTMYRPLIRDLARQNRGVSARQISTHIQSIMKLVDNNSGGPLSARALGSTRATLAGASWSDILSQGSWSASSTFDTFYRLTRSVSTNITEMVLSAT
ncbi:hypothetical protein BJ085DRAFT_21682 [Dimargaris cristalligena]|uniref:Tyr recombinase domain-containing protein n=1 Tax=Dimargaris cristalligena TaxID=215637 RepID=A0A4P9ZNS8_9FUNG|nr:hypothetical protein BJ085DRAFT_21682 [Dimargaris cristalligena]|eukprot:RKP34202.1 hypothetical protein BJ085DRAFT_21682 [Dimargaris cristalligena]